MPSIGIYSYELFKFFDVKNIIRIGSAGAYSETLNLYDVLLADSAWSESTYAKVQSGDYDSQYTYPSESLNEKLVASAKALDIPIKRGVIHSSDVFYRKNHEEFKTINKKYEALAVEMESFALFHNAKILGKNAACLLTISDSLVKNEATTSKERQTAFTKMMEIALQLA
jgi:purine-nucleoside phosphorylase